MRKIMVRFLVSAAVLLASSVGVASQCRKDLQSLLRQAQGLVQQQFEAGEPCLNAALIGRTKGRPGCYPPRAFALRDLLSPVFANAQSVCRGSCQAEGMRVDCEKITSKDHLTQWGILPTLEMLKSSP